jgi:hypothetical protein
MCSGCSGAFDGAGEDRELKYRWSFEDESRLAEGVAQETDMTERAAPETLLGRSMGWAEDYEVLVSAERIIERRIIRAKRHVFSETGTLDDWEAWQVSRTECKQANPETAKYYRTHGGCDSNSRNEGAIGGMWLMCWYLGGLAVFALVLWLALG